MLKKIMLITLVSFSCMYSMENKSIRGLSDSRVTMYEGFIQLLHDNKDSNLNLNELEQQVYRRLTFQQITEKLGQKISDVEFNTLKMPLAMAQFHAIFRLQYLTLDINQKLRIQGSYGPITDEYFKYMKTKIKN